MLRGFLVILMCQLVGEAVSRGFGSSVPGPVLGIFLLAVGLAVWGRSGENPDETDVAKVGYGLLSAFPLFFVPAGVGVMQYFDLLAQHGFILGAAVIVSTILTMLVTVGVFLFVKQKIKA